jgi:UPF0755 protein
MNTQKEPPVFKILFVYLPVVIVIAFLFSFSLFLLSPVQLSAPVTIEISQGMPLNTVAKNLYESGVITDVQKFKLLVRVLNLSKKIHAGEYQFKDRMTPFLVLKFLTHGLVKKYTISIPEGFTAKQIIALLLNNGLGKAEEFERILSDDGFLRSHGLEGKGLEGYLFPDTYIFYKGMSEKEMLSEMLRNFKRKLPVDAEENAKSHNLTLHEAVILASIVQKETYKSDEMPLVASVFYNRLKKGIPLQADPTVIYAIPDFSGNLRKVDLKIKSPYNTYIHRGLPPGPICNPGLDAINAVLRPSDAPYLYFVSRNDGSHDFSVSLKEHNKKVDLYQLKRR